MHADCRFTGILRHDICEIEEFIYARDEILERPGRARHQETVVKSATVSH